MMKNKWSKTEKITDNIYSEVKACSILTVQGIANGRTIPVIFAENDNENKIETTIKFHQTVKQGVCSTQWGITEDNKYALLFLVFSVPTETKILLFFDVLKFSSIIDLEFFSIACFSNSFNVMLEIKKLVSSSNTLVPFKSKLQVS